jgi:hypothetical protein
MLTERDVVELPTRELARLLAQGNTIDASALDDTEYRGTSLGLPRFVEAMTWKTFRKTFHRDPATGRLRGWNVRLEQTGPAGAGVPLLKGGVPVTFGHYTVTPLPEGGGPGGVSRGLLLDYGQGDAGRLSPLSRVRDPIVALNEGSAELLLGWSYLALGGSALGTPSYFLLRREGPLGQVVQVPR